MIKKSPFIPFITILQSCTTLKKKTINKNKNQIKFFKWPVIETNKLLGHKWLPSNLTYLKKPPSFHSELFVTPGVLSKEKKKKICFSYGPACFVFEKLNYKDINGFLAT